MNIIFSENSGVADSVYGNAQMPIQMFCEQRGEEIEKNTLLKDLFRMGTSQNFGDSFTAMTAMQGPQPVGENGAYPMDSMEQSYTKSMIYETWKSSFAISQEMVEDGKLLDMKKQPAAFMTAWKRARELFGAAMFGGAMGGQKAMNFRGKSFDLTCADGEALFSKAHPAKADAKLKQCNIFSDEFSVDALGKMETAMHQFRGDTGELLEVAPSTILIGDDSVLKKNIFAAIGADKDPVSANNAFNYQYGRWSIIVWPFLNDYIGKGQHPWILMDSDYNQTYGGGIWNDRIQLALKSTVDDETDANIWRGRSRFNACFNDWRAFAVGGISGGQALG